MKRSILAVALFLPGACAEQLPTAESSGPVSASTRAVAYERNPLTSSVQVRFTIRNHGSDVLSFGRCDQEVSAEVERRTPSGWTQVSSAVCPAHLPMVALQLQPGGDYESRVSLREAGRYRIRLAYGAPGWQYMRTAYSNEFLVQ